MWGTPNCLSRTMTTSSRGEYVRSTWSGGTPKVESLKYLSSWSAGRPGAAWTRSPYIGSWVALCSGRWPSARKAVSWAALAVPLVPGGRMSWKPPKSLVPNGSGAGAAAAAGASTASAQSTAMATRAGTAREGTSGAALVRHNTGTDAGRRHSCRELRADAARGEDRVGVGERAGVHDRGREVRSARQAGGRVEVESQRAGRAELDGAPAVADCRRAELAAGAADGHRARLGRHVGDHALEAVGGVERQRPGAQPAARRRDLGHPREHLGRAQLAVAARAEHAEHRARAQVRRRRQQDRVGQRARQARLVAVREDVAADVDHHDQVAAQPLRGVVEPGGDRAGAGVRVDEEGRDAERLGDTALGEAKAARPGGGRAGERGDVVDPLDEPVGLVERARPGDRVDRPP